MALSVGQVRTLSVSLGKGRAGSYEIISGDESVAQVAGKALTAVGEGETVITARAYNGAQASMTLTVLPAPKALSFTADAVTLGVGEKLALDLACDPCVPMDITYESSRPKVAKVTSSGVIKGMKASGAPVTITATAHNGVKAECVVTVKPKAEIRTVSCPTGNVTLTNVGSAATVTFTVTGSELGTVANSAKVYATDTSVVQLGTLQRSAGSNSDTYTVTITALKDGASTIAFEITDPDGTAHSATCGVNITVPTPEPTPVPTPTPAPTPEPPAETDAPDEGGN